MRVILRYVKFGYARFMSNSETIRAIERNLRRAEIPMVFSKGFHPMPRISYLDAMATGVVNRALYLSLEVEDWEGEMFERLKKTALRGLEPRACWIDDVELNSIVDGYSFRLILESSSVGRIGPEVEIERKGEVFRLGERVEGLSLRSLKNFLLVEYTLKREKLFSPWLLVESVKLGDGIHLPICLDALHGERGLSDYLNERRDGNVQAGHARG